jgi:hypothetical protein
LKKNEAARSLFERRDRPILVYVILTGGRHGDVDGGVLVSLGGFNSVVGQEFDLAFKLFHLDNVVPDLRDQFTDLRSFRDEKFLRLLMLLLDFLADSFEDFLG